MQSAHEYFPDSSRLPPCILMFFLEFLPLHLEFLRFYGALAGEIFWSIPSSVGIDRAYLNTAMGRNCRYPRVLKIIVPYISDPKGL